MERCIQKPSAILSTIHYIVKKTTRSYYRNGIELEKNAIITPNRIDKNRKLYENYCWLWSVYPDRLVELLTPTTSKFKLKYFQIIFLRVCMRHGRILTIAPRAAGKSFICILAQYLICMTRPHSHAIICSPGKAQGAKIGTQKIRQLWSMLPLLKDEIVGEGNFGSDYVKLTFRNGSVFDILTPLQSTRGNRATAGIIDEFRNFICGSKIV